jgi:hypothetical protein
MICGQLTLCDATWAAITIRLMVLRDFLYLDRDLVRNFLAQIEGGVLDEMTEREKSSGRGGLSGKVGFGPVGAGADKSKETSRETEAVFRQVAAGEFDRLYRHLESEDLVIFDEVADAAIVSQIERKQFLEVDARVTVAGLHQFAALLGDLTSAGPLLGMLGIDDDDLDEETVAAMQAFAALANNEKALSVVATVPGSAGLRVALDLDRAWILTGAWDLDASVLLKVQRIIKADENYIVGDPFGGMLKLMPESERESLMEALTDDEAAELGISDAVITSPGLVGTAIAIYR